MPLIVYFDENNIGRCYKTTKWVSRLKYIIVYFTWIFLISFYFWSPCITRIFMRKENYIKEYWVSFKNNYVEQKVCVRMKIYFNLVWSKFILFASVTKCNNNYYNKLYVTVNNNELYPIGTFKKINFRTQKYIFGKFLVQY